MDPQVDKQWALVRLFCEFTLLPELLNAYPNFPYPGPKDAARDRVVIRRLSRILRYRDCNTDHLGDEFDQLRRPIFWESMAQDVLQLCMRLQLINDTGLLDAGEEISSLVLQEPLDETRLMPLLRAQVATCYVAPNNVNVVTLLQEGATRLQQQRIFPGLLLVEFEALVYRAFTAPLQAPKLAAQLVDNRRQAIDAYTASVDQWDQNDPLLLHDIVAAYYLSDDALIGLSPLTVTEMRSSAMLLCYAALLEELFPAGPVNCLGLPRTV